MFRKGIVRINIRYTFGSAEPRSISRGKRGIAGTIVFTLFDRDALVDALAVRAAKAAYFQRIGGDINYQPYTITEWDQKLTNMVVNSINSNGNDSQVASSNPFKVTQNIAVQSTPKYSDEIPPFDITLSFANEYGQSAVMVIYGCEILNEASSFSVDSTTTDKACTYIARSVDYLQPVENKYLLDNKY